MPILICDCRKLNGIISFVCGSAGFWLSMCELLYLLVIRVVRFIESECLQSLHLRLANLWLFRLFKIYFRLIGNDGSRKVSVYNNIFFGLVRPLLEFDLIETIADCFVLAMVFILLNEFTCVLELPHQIANLLLLVLI